MTVVIDRSGRSSSDVARRRDRPPLTHVSEGGRPMTAWTREEAVRSLTRRRLLQGSAAGAAASLVNAAAGAVVVAANVKPRCGGGLGLSGGCGRRVH